MDFVLRKVYYQVDIQGTWGLLAAIKKINLKSTVLAA